MPRHACVCESAKVQWFEVVECCMDNYMICTTCSWLSSVASLCHQVADVYQCTWWLYLFACSSFMHSSTWLCKWTAKQLYPLTHMRNICCRTPCSNLLSLSWQPTSCTDQAVGLNSGVWACTSEKQTDRHVVRGWCTACHAATAKPPSSRATVLSQALFICPRPAGSSWSSWSVKAITEQGGCSGSWYATVSRFVSSRSCVRAHNAFWLGAFFSNHQINVHALTCAWPFTALQWLARDCDFSQIV